jgi:2-amino-4-hydroxy-6-hydroxymethyldihydropteridine diphosphokinase
MTTAYIALGSNLNHPARQLQRAISAMTGLPDSQVEAISPVYRSPAVGPGEQNDYLNAVCSVTTGLSPIALLDQLQGLENLQGRVRTVRWGARTLDLDILLYGDRSIDTARLKIPHPEMQKRHFALYPLADIAGTKMVLPCGTDIGTLLTLCPREGLTLTEVTLHKSTDSKQGARC